MKTPALRPLLTGPLLLTLSCLACAAPTWQNISSEAGRRIELDRTTLKRDGNTVEAQSRVILERELSDVRTGAGYRIIEATTRYDCGTRNAQTIRRVFKKNDKDIIREEELKGNALPVRSGTLDDKVLREVCRPPKEDQSEVAKKANEAAGALKTANENLVKEEKKTADTPAALKANDKAKDKVTEKPPEAARIPSIRPNLKASVEAAASTQPVPPADAKKPISVTPPESKPITAPPPPPKPAPTPIAARSVPVSPPPAPKSKPTPAAGGYMLELARNDTPLPPGTRWSHEGIGGPENWARLDPRNKLCAMGQRQSPIDIRDGIRVDLEAIRFDYRPSTFRIVDTGNTIKVEVGDSSFTLTGKTYDLSHIEFQRPAEIRVNGKRYELGAHLIHRSSDGEIAIVSVLMDPGTEHPFIQSLWNHLPLERELAVLPPSTVVNPVNLLPAAREYFTFMGSLTTPPCTEGVLWLVMKQPIQISDEQIRIFNRLYRHNARPIQPTRDRLIKESR